MRRLVLYVLLGICSTGRSLCAQEPIQYAWLPPPPTDNEPWPLLAPADEVHRLPPVPTPTVIPEAGNHAGPAQGRSAAPGDGPSKAGLSLKRDREFAIPDGPALSLNDADPFLKRRRTAPQPGTWQGSFELGLNGSEGNSPTLNFRVGFDAKRKTKHDICKLDLDYIKKTSDNRETANRLYSDNRYERLLPLAPWTWFVHETTEYDEFKAYDVRVTGDSGLGYQFIDTQVTWLIGRAGAGTSYEIGGPEHHAVPEMTFGVDYEHLITRRQKILASVEYIPELTGLTEFRSNAKAVWEAVLDDQMNLSMRIGVLDRYDSSPHGKKPNDVDYSVTVLWNF